MGKGQVVLVSSSEGEGDGGGEMDAWTAVRLRRGPKRSTSRSRDSPAASKRRRSLRKGGGRPVLGESHCSEQANFDSLSEDFLECTHGSNDIHGMKEQWVDKHRPCSIAELAVHKKKVEEVRVWLEERINAPKEGMRNYTLLITGQAGVGKSAVIHAISSQLEAELCEWKTPTPTLWKEHMHNSNSGVSYMSKLDEFETFVNTVRKYPVLPSTHVNGLRKPIIMLIDDLPVTSGKVAHGRLCECLRALACSTQVPTVILVTEYSKDDSNDVRGGYMEELVSSLERSGAYKVCFNPLTANSIKKTLSLICRKEEYNVPEEVLNQIARLSQGDIRHAITSLQYFCLSPESKESATHPEGNSDLAALSSLVIDVDNFPSGRVTIPFGRDETLTLFHALGKFLHNKRVNGDPSSLGMQKGALSERLMRLPLKMDAPEDVLCQAHAQARPVVDFLHENVLDFLSDEAVDDAWIIASYLSDADHLLSASFSPTRVQMVKGSHGPETLLQSAAACVSVRGVLFGNSQPSTSRWHSIRRPKLWEVEQSSRRNKALMASERFELQAHCGLQALASIAELASEHKPMARWPGLVRPDGQDGGLVLQDNEEDEDDIQEW